MREIRPSGSEGRETGRPAFPTPIVVAIGLHVAEIRMVPGGKNRRKRLMSSTPEGIRTPNPRFRRPMLYPVELRARGGTASWRV